MSIRYNMKVRKGRGFNPAELKAVGLSSRNARTIGIAVDMRRKNKSDESFERNVERLKEYLGQVVILSKQEIAKRKKESPTVYGLDSSVRKMGDVSQPTQELEIVKLDKLSNLGSAYGTTRNARHHKKQIGFLPSRNKGNFFITLQTADIFWRAIVPRAHTHLLFSEVFTDSFFFPLRILGSFFSSSFRIL